MATLDDVMRRGADPIAAVIKAVSFELGRFPAPQASLTERPAIEGPVPTEQSLVDHLREVLHTDPDESWSDRYDASIRLAAAALAHAMRVEALKGRG